MKKTAILLLLAACCLGYSVTAGAQAEPWHSYAAKFVCGNISNESGSMVSDGRYFTTVNIHNPHYLQMPTGGPGPVIFYKKIVLAQPQGFRPHPPSCFIQEALRSDESLAVTCKNIKQQLALSGLPSAGFREGFVVLLVPPFQGIESAAAPELDVEAIYTGRTRAGLADVNLNGVSAWDVEHVDFKDVRGNPDPVECILPD